MNVASGITTQRFTVYSCISFTGDEYEYAEIVQCNHSISGLGCEFLKDDGDYTVPARDEFTLHTQLRAKHLTRESVK